MAAYRRVYDSRHLQSDCQEQGSAPEPYKYGIHQKVLKRRRQNIAAYGSV